MGKRGPAILAVNRKRGCFLQFMCAYTDSAARAVAFWYIATVEDRIMPCVYTATCSCVPHRA